MGQVGDDDKSVNSQFILQKTSTRVEETGSLERREAGKVGTKMATSCKLFGKSV